MGKYFSAKDTRQVVSNNFNAVRGLFRLSSPKLTELVQPITEIPYSKFRPPYERRTRHHRRRAKYLYELLAVPPTTFMFLVHQTTLKTNWFFLKKGDQSCKSSFRLYGNANVPVLHCRKRKLASSPICRSSPDKVRRFIHARKTRGERQAVLFRRYFAEDARGIYSQSIPD